MGYIYQIRNKKNGRCLIGQTEGKASKRLNRHRSDVRYNGHHNPAFQNAWNKYGEDAFAFEVVEEVETLEQLNNLETLYIATAKNPYNIRRGGDHTGRQPESIRKKLTEANRGRKVSVETRKRMSESHKRRYAQMTSDERTDLRKKISQSKKGKGMNLTKEQLSAAGKRGAAVRWRKLP